MDEISEMKEKTFKIPVVDEKTHFIMAYEEVIEEEAMFLATYKLGTEEIQKSIRGMLNVG